MYRIPLEKINLKVNSGPFVFNVLLDAAFTKEGLSASGNTLMHCHPAFEVHFLTAGNVYLKLEHGEIPVQDGDVILIPPNVFHGFIGDSPCQKGYFQFTYSLREPYDDLFPEMEIAEILKVLTGLSEVTVLRSADVLHLITSIQIELLDKRMGSYTKTQSLLAQLLIDLFRMVQNLPASSNEKPKLEHRFPLKTIDDSRIRLIDMFIHQILLFEKPLRIELLAQQLSLSVKQTQRIIQQLYGKSFKQIVVESQIEIAKDLLRTSNMTIAQIAERSGFKEKERFIRRFVELMGQTPTQYRNAVMPATKP